MSELAIIQSEAITSANLMLASLNQTVVLAAKTGAALIKVKETMPHGTFQAWVEANMPVRYRQCSKFMNLAKEKPELLDSKVHLNALLDIDSELKLLTMDNEQQDEIRDVASELELTQKQISELTAAVKKGEQTAEEWRQQFLDLRKEARSQAERAANLERELQEAKNKPAEVIYVDNSEKALEQYREETEAKLQDLKDQAQKAREDLQTAKIQQNAAIKSGIESELKKRSDEVERLQKQETAIVGRIDVLRTDLDALENQALHINAIREFKQSMNGMNVALATLFDDDVVCDGESKNRWIVEIHKAKTMLDQAELQVGSVERLI